MTIEDSIVAALYHLHVSRKKEKIIHKKEQETVAKERFVVKRTVRINTAIWIYDQYFKLSGLTGLSTTQIFYIQLSRELWNMCDYFLVDILANVFFVRCI